MVGYSRLMEADERGTLARLRTHRQELIDPAIAKNNGRIIKTTGDGMLVEFQSVTEAVQCAVEVQERMARRNADVSPARWLQFRIGINLGDVIVEGDDILGDGVNVAARLETLAEPGGVCVSAAVRDQIGTRLGLAFERSRRADGQEHRPADPRLPHRDRRPRARRRRRQPSPPDTAAKPSIAVLPFVNMSGDAEQEFFADGLTEDIITELSRFRDLLVISRNSAFVHKGKAVQVQAVAREFGVHYVRRGQRAQGRQPGAGHRAADRRRDRPPRLGRTLRPRARRHLRDPGRGHRAITATLPGRVEAATHDRTNRKPPQNMAAYEYVLTGKVLHHRSTPRTMKRRSGCSIARSRSIRNTRTPMPGVRACSRRPGSTTGARIGRPPGAGRRRARRRAGPGRPRQRRPSRARGGESGARRPREGELPPGARPGAQPEQRPHPGPAGRAADVARPARGWDRVDQEGDARQPLPPRTLLESSGPRAARRASMPRRSRHSAASPSPTIPTTRSTPPRWRRWATGHRRRRTHRKWCARCPIIRPGASWRRCITSRTATGITCAMRS